MINIVEGIMLSKLLTLLSILLYDLYFYKHF